MKNKILFGICGIGRGHIYRQLPIISHYEKGNDIVIFAFDESFEYFTRFYKNHKNIKVFPVAVPWIHGSLSGIDFLKTYKDNRNSREYMKVNFKAMYDAEEFFGTPDLIISDYEPVSAQYAYLTNKPLVTIDQQTKYFYEGYPEQLEGLSYQEERFRLGSFFPYADLRIVSSFFIPPSNKIVDKKYKSIVVPPIIRTNIEELQKQATSPEREILFYISPYSEFVQSAKSINEVLSMFPEFKFHLFISKKSKLYKKHKWVKNISVYSHGSEHYLNLLRKSSAAICTSGHTIISEMLYLGKPLYTIPLGTYEQKFNAFMVDTNKFGLSSKSLNQHDLSIFLEKIDTFKRNIFLDTKTLLSKKNGKSQVISLLDNFLQTHD
jgi:uncharacterized protein (TIGR00661 family)